MCPKIYLIPPSKVDVCGRLATVTVTCFLQTDDFQLGRHREKDEAHGRTQAGGKIPLHLHGHPTSLLGSQAGGGHSMAVAWKALNKNKKTSARALLESLCKRSPNPPPRLRFLRVSLFCRKCSILLVGSRLTSIFCQKTSLPGTQGGRLRLQYNKKINNLNAR